MSATEIGTVKSTQGKTYRVKWDMSNGDVYVSWGGWSHVGTASTAAEAMAKSEAWLYGK